MLYLVICLAILTSVIVPPTGFWNGLAYIITWPEHLGKWIKENFEKPSIVNTVQIKKEKP